jgi:hypothetical protein
VYEGDPRMIVNLSVWQSLEALHHFVYRSAHVGVLRDRKQWFEPLPGPYYALWWVPRDHIPSVQEGLQRIDYLATHGPSEHAFWFGTRFAMPEPGRSVHAPEVQND